MGIKCTTTIDFSMGAGVLPVSPPFQKLRYQYVNILLAQLTSLKSMGSLLGIKLLMCSIELSSFRIFSQ